MPGFELPADLRYNRGLITDPAAYAAEMACASWLYLVGDEWETMPEGIPYADVLAAHPRVERVISDPPRELTLDLAKRQFEALDRMPRPTLVTCRRGPRSAAAAYLYAGARAGASADDVMDAARRDQAPFCGNAEIESWIRDTLAALG